MGTQSRLVGVYDPNASDWESIRLPEWISPSRYNLFVDTDMELFQFAGNVTIDLTVDEPSRFIVLHTLHLQVAFKSLVSHGKSFALSKMASKDSVEQTILYFDSPLPSGDYTLVMTYSGALNNGLEGFYKSEFPGLDGQPRYLATTQFEPVNARRAFPCFDEPAKKAIFDITLAADSQYHALSNMPIRSVKSLENGRRVFDFEPTVKMASYLVAYVVSNFHGISSTTQNGINITVYTRPHSTHLGEYALKTAVTVMDYYQQKYRIDFPLPKCDFIAIPDFAAGAMENWGLITFRDSALLFDPESSDANNKQRIATVIAHELVHQWFGNLVTMKWWSDLWLNEGFAEFMEYKGADAAEPFWQTSAQFIPKDTVRALNADESLFTHSIAVPVMDPIEIQDIFDDISYGKGSTVLRMLEDYLDRVFGPDYFFDRLHNYLIDHSYGNAETAQLWAALHSPISNVSRFMSTWTDQPGFPVVTVSDLKTLPSGLAFDISQERFLLATLIDATKGLNVLELPALVRPVVNPGAQLWAIPFSFTTLKMNKKGKVVRQPDTAKPFEFYEHGPVTVQLNFTSNEEVFLLANLGRSGMYRVQYSYESYSRLGKWLRKDVNILTPSERAGFVSDVFALSFAARLEDIRIALEFIRFLEHDSHPVVWETALSELKNFKKAFSMHPLLGQVIRYMNKMMGNIIESLGWIETTQDEQMHELRAMLRGQILQEAVWNGHPKVVKKALELFSQVQKDPSFAKTQTEYAIESYGAILDAGVMYGSERSYRWVLKKFLSSTFAPDQMRYMDALASSPTPYLQSETLGLALTGQIRRQDITSLIEKVATNTPVGHISTYLFLMDNWNQVTSLWMGGDFSKFNDALERIVGRFTRSSLIDEVERLWIYKEHKEFYIPANSVTSVVKGLEKSKQLHAWKTMVADVLEQWLLLEVGEVDSTDEFGPFEVQDTL